MSITEARAPRGLAGLVVTETAIGDVLGAEGRYHYRGHDAIELARAADFERAWHLVVLGGLPDADATARFRARTAATRVPPPAVREVVATAAAELRDPLRGLQTALPVLSAARGGRPLYDLTEDERVEEALAIASAAPVILAACHRAERGLDPFPPAAVPAEGTAADYLRRVTGREPDDTVVRALSAYLIATIDHGLNASTFAARVIASTGADMASCVAGGLGALSGPLHGGAPSRALDALDAVGTPDRIEPFVRGELTAGRRLMGFGHAVYRTADPRARLLREVALELGGPRVGLAVEYERIAERLLAQHRPGRELHVNVEFYAAVVLERCGIPREMLTPTFAVARIIGWTAHVLEQARDPKIIRPSSRYVA